MSDQPSTASSYNESSELTSTNIIESHVVRSGEPMETDTIVVESLTVVEENDEDYVTNEIGTIANDNLIIHENVSSSNKPLENAGNSNSIEVDISKSKKNPIVFFMKKPGQQIKQQQVQDKNPIVLVQEPVPSQVHSSSISSKQILEPQVTGKQILEPQVTGVTGKKIIEPHFQPKPLVTSNNRIQVANPINIIGKISDVNSSNNSLNINSLPLNFLGSSTPQKTTVKQPNTGPCMCFVCGQNLSDPTDRICYLKTRKLGSTQVTLLELLSEILDQTVVTDTNSVDLCPTCSKLIIETDNAVSHVNKLKRQINAYFTNNQRPKLTYQVFPKNSNISIVPCGNITQPVQLPQTKAQPNQPTQVISPPSQTPQLISQPNQPPQIISQPNQPPKFNIDDLKAERLKRLTKNRKKKVVTTEKTSSTTKKTNSAEETSQKKYLNRKGYTLERLYACNICKVKFEKKDMVVDHMVKDHEIHPAGLSRSNAAKSPRKQSQTNENNKEKSTTTNTVKKELNENKTSTDIPKNYTNSVSNAKNSTNIESNAKINANIKSKTKNSSENNSVPNPKVDTSAASQLLAAMKPIKPRPSPSLVQKAPDGSMIFYLNPTAVDSAPTVIKVSPGNTNPTGAASVSKSFIPSSFPCSKCSKTFLDEKSRRMHRISEHSLNKRKRDGDNLEESEEESDVKRFGHLKYWQCKACEILFNSKIALENHRNEAHLNDQPKVNQQKESLQECDQCDEAFIHKNELDKHKETHL